MNVFLDDTRPNPPGFKLARTAAEAIQYLKTGKVSVLSLDFDLGTLPVTGYDVVRYIVENHIYPKQIIIHSANPFGRQKMLGLLLKHKPASVKVSVSPLPWI
ncbi:cyclic-phosphate processing receiver domain-containing protein [Paenibacillus hamazuiensis]|uniref:cyclic-phosphate processing receiver domain-containing protein n=1 Tax=Paenibacillus hamazuiensis TaxID=2936508 RepID=UPI00200CAEC7|nr:cyclic-phosphate processing receiver domain-containing protein [Paenibacillus hamazuiensis]